MCLVVMKGQYDFKTHSTDHLVTTGYNSFPYMAGGVLSVVGQQWGDLKSQGMTAYGWSFGLFLFFFLELAPPFDQPTQKRREKAKD